MKSQSPCCPFPWRPLWVLGRAPLGFWEAWCTERSPGAVFFYLVAGSRPRELPACGVCVWVCGLPGLPRNRGPQLTSPALQLSLAPTSFAKTGYVIPLLEAVLSLVIPCGQADSSLADNYPALSNSIGGIFQTWPCPPGARGKFFYL